MILNRQKVIERLKQGETIEWHNSFVDTYAYMGKDTVRWDTLCKLERDGIITSFGYPDLHGTVRLKESK